ncbi:hypothetical protein AVEN_168324-1, partial [Araneus ventricosus]
AKRVGRDENKEHEGGRIHRTPSQTMEMQPPPPWIPEVSSSIDALAGTVTNVPKGGYKVFEEDAHSPDKKKRHHEGRHAHPPYRTEQMPEQQQPPPPPWLPEVSSSLDALAGTVVNMTKNLEIQNDKAKSKGKLILTSEYHFENHDRGESLDSTLAKEKDYKSNLKAESGSEEEIFRAIIVAGGFNAKNEDDSDSGDEFCSFFP